MSHLKQVTDVTSSPSSPPMYETPSPPSTASSPDLYTADTVVDLPSERQPISPIHPPTSWQRSFIPVLADETTRLVPQSPSRSDAPVDINIAFHADLARAYAMHNSEIKAYARDRFIIGGTVLCLTTIVLVIVVSGVTTMLANRNYPQLEVYSDWPNGGIIPLKYGCHAPNGEPMSIPLRWRNIPRQATSLAVLFANPGSIKKNGIDPVHWFVTDIPLNNGGPNSLPANSSANSAMLPEGTKQHTNAFSKNGGYWPPCVHNGTSFFAVHIYAVEASPTIEDYKDAREIMNRFVGVPVARITGIYGKPSNLLYPSPTDGDGNDSDLQEADLADNDPEGVADYHGLHKQPSSHETTSDKDHQTEGEHESDPHDPSKTDDDKTAQS